MNNKKFLEKKKTSEYILDVDFDIPCVKDTVVAFDHIFVVAMNMTVIDMMKEFNARTGYAHSDEITLIFAKVETEKSQHIFDGKIQKIISLSSSYCSVQFNKNLANLVNKNKEMYDENFINLVNDKIQTFDARIITFSDDKIHEVVNHQIWRSVRDCYRNAISSFTRHFYSHNTIDGRNNDEMIKMLKEKDFDWTQVPIHLKHGIYCKKETYNKKIDDGTECVRTKFVLKSFIINFSENMIKLMFDKYWNSDFTDNFVY